MFTKSQSVIPALAAAALTSLTGCERTAPPNPATKLNATDKPSTLQTFPPAAPATKIDPKPALEKRVALFENHNPVKEVVFEGDSSRGKIYHLQQIHHPPSDSKSQTEEFLAIAESQSNILGLLDYLSPKNLFPEGWAHSDAEFETVFKDVIPKIKKEFPTTEIPPHFTPQQYALMMSHGAWVVYKVLHPEVVLHPVIDRERDSDIFKFEDEWGDKLTSTPRELFEKIVKRRQEAAVQQVELFLDKNPGQSVALVYGHADEFGWVPGLKAHLERIGQPGLVQHVTFFFSDLLKDTQEYPDLQIRIVDACKEIPRQGVQWLSPTAFKRAEETHKLPEMQPPSPSWIDW